MNTKQIIHKVTPLGSIGTEGLVIPNHSGDLSAGNVLSVPVNPEDPVNKAYCDANAGGGGHTIQEEGVDLTQRTNLNFTGTGVTATDDAGNDATKVTINLTDTSGLVPYTGATTDVDLGANDLTVDTDTLFVDSTNGRLGVGTTTPSQPIEVISQTIGYMAAFRAMFNHTSGAILRVYKSRGTYASPLRTRNGDTLGGQNAFGYYAADDSSAATTGSVSAQFYFKATEAHTSTAQGASFTLNLVSVGSTSLTQAMLIYHDGTYFHFNLSALPTSSTGLAAGDIWVDTAAGNVLKRV